MKISSILFVGAFLGIAAVVGMRAIATEAPRRETAMVTVDHITAAEAMEHARPYLSRDGAIYSRAPNTIAIVDERQHVGMVEEVISRADVAPREVTLHFQIIRASDGGMSDALLQNISNALGGLLRFDGYELIGQTVVTLSEQRSAEQRVRGGDSPLYLAVKLQDVRGGGSVDLSISLHGLRGVNVISSNVVIPNGQTVVLGSAYPGDKKAALLLTVRPVIGSRDARTTSKNRVYPLMEAEMAYRSVDSLLAHTDSMTLVADSILAHFGEDSMTINLLHGDLIKAKVVVPTPKKSSARTSPRPVPPVPPRPPEAR